ncbi:hypothetical protein [Pseudoxanthomonas wuyuanensis]|uniref:Uncharacterized protein n=1 Tax=Pseudoxanthomonas wuyuanensis TaxID=1073196 RepID=A0A286D8Z1_9GAMM|nr:hypothetical protein [Pseudoxanthomonas wuyuanensis]SOD55124.1 hypothetical protein SAMN06296416_10689 [Pseudoxanthomonas wuyuanensis]
MTRRSREKYWAEPAQRMTSFAVKGPPHGIAGGLRTFGGNAYGGSALRGLEMAPFNSWFHAVNIDTLDGLSDEEMAAIPVQYENGRHGDWDHPPAATAHM